MRHRKINKIAIQDVINTFIGFDSGHKDLLSVRDFLGLLFSKIMIEHQVKSFTFSKADYFYIGQKILEKIGYTENTKDERDQGNKKLPVNRLFGSSPIRCARSWLKKAQRIKRSNINRAISLLVSWERDSNIKKGVKEISKKDVSCLPFFYNEISHLQDIAILNPCWTEYTADRAVEFLLSLGEKLW